MSLVKTLTKTTVLFLFAGIMSACEDEQAKSCAELQQNEKKAFLQPDVCANAAEKGDPFAQWYMGKLALQSGDKKSAVDFFEKSAQQNYGAAFFELGEMYLAENDEPRAQFNYKRGCQLGHVKSCEQQTLLENKAAELLKATQLKAQQDLEKQKIEQEAKLAAKKAKLAQELQRHQAERMANEAKIAAEKAKLEQEQKRFEAEKAANEAKLAAEKLKLERERVEAEKRANEEKLAAEKQKQAQESSGSASKTQKSVHGSSLLFGSGVTIDTSNKIDTTGLNFQEGLAKFQQNGLWGFVDSAGNVVISPQFHSVGGFYQGRALVEMADQRWGYIDKKSQWVTNPIFCAAGRFSEGLAGVYYGGYRSGDNCYGGKWGYLDLNGNWALQPVFDYAERFSQGKAKVTYNGMTGFINKRGEWVR